MKVTNSSKPSKLTSASDKSLAASAQPAAKAATADDISLLGVPEAELTPKVRAALLELVEEIQNLRAELRHARARAQELETLADHDPMFEVLNRRAFARELDRALAMIDRYKAQASLVFIDLNDLKKLNDTYGHGAGDAALAHVASTLTANVRQTDVVARLGGDEFAILLLQADDATASTKAAAISDIIAATPVDFEGNTLSISVSWGAVEIMKGVSAQEAMNLADEAMYQAKRMK